MTKSLQYLEQAKELLRKAQVEASVVENNQDLTGEIYGLRLDVKSIIKENK